jgi:hypothetical protein
LPAADELMEGGFVSDQPSNRWAALLDRLLEAKTLSDAQLAASDLIDEAVPGGAVLAADAPGLVRAIRSRQGLVGHPYRSYLLAVLLAMAEWQGTWRRSVAQGDTSLAATKGSEGERETASELAAACVDLWQQMVILKSAR